MEKVKVYIVDESLPIRKFLEDGLSKYGYLEVVGGTGSYADARVKIPALRPDVVICDVRIMNIDGISFIRKIMNDDPVRIITVSTVSTARYEFLAAGSAAFIQRPSGMVRAENNRFFLELAAKVISVARTPMNLLSGGRFIGSDSLRASSRLDEPASADGSESSLSTAPVINPPVQFRDTAAENQIYSSNCGSSEPRTAGRNILIAMGASTGGTEALLEVLRDLPENTPGIVLVQHMPPGFTKMFATRLDSLCRMSVSEARNGDRVRTGHILVAPGDLQMQVEKSAGGYSVRCVPGNKINGHRPSVDVLFESVARVACPDVIGVILTGMGSDGSKGMLEMKKRGAYTIGQDEATCVVYGMPMVACKLGAVTRQLPLKKISAEITAQLARM